MGSEIVRDVVIGMSDGLTVPFALAAGLSGIANSTKIVITGGLAEIAAGSIAMGLGGYLAARSDAEHYAKAQETEQREVETIPDVETEEVEQVLLTYGLEKEQSVLVANSLRQRPTAWIDFMMRFELGLEKPNPKRALTSVDHWFLLYRWRVCPIGALHADSESWHHPRVLSRVHSGSSVDLWVRKRPFHRHATRPQRVSDRVDRRAGGSRGLWSG